MTELPAFLLACLALLAAPGPTNALAAASGAQRGLRPSLPLVAAVLTAYVVAVAVWSVILGLVAGTQPWVPIAAKLLAVLFLLRTAFRLWRTAKTSAPATITPTQVATVTLFNPKALVFAFAIFPPFGWPDIMPFAAGFAALVLACTVGWIALGAAAGSTRWLDSKRINQITAGVLVVFAVLLVIQSLLGMH